MKDNLLFRLWGKTNERGPREDAWQWKSHPAICHMVDVAYVAETWLKLSPQLMRQFIRLAGPGYEEEELRRLIVLLVALHDLGKVHRSFQAKSPEGWREGYGSIGMERPADGGNGFDHGKGSARIIRVLGRDELPEWRAWQSLIDAVAAHHGRLYTKDELREKNIVHFPIMCDAERTVAAEAIRVLMELFGIERLPDTPPRTSAFAMLLTGFCSVADWFGSNSDGFQFCPVSNPQELRAYLDDLRRREVAAHMLRDAGIRSAFRQEQPTFLSLFDFLASRDDMRPLQRRAEDVPFGRSRGPEMLVAEAPMGMGKTELALYFAACALQSERARGMYFALPTQASSNALLNRIVRFSQVVHAPGEDVSLALAHGGKRFNSEYQKLQGATWKLRQALERAREHGTADDVRDAAPGEVVAPSWLQSSKRSLLAGLGVGTIDQAMLGAICARHAFVRLFALAGKVVVFDEIHAYDAYMNEVIVHLLRWLHALGADVVLLSATLPRTLLTRLVAAYGAAELPAPDADGRDPYPQMLHVVDGAVVRYVPEEEPGAAEETARVIDINMLEAAETEHTAVGARHAVELASKGGCVAWIRNTVRHAQEALDAVRMELRLRGIHGVRVALLHARFVRNDRNIIEEDLVDILGRRGGDRRPERIIVIATQVIEQSVDVDFDAMISDLAPVDLLLQRAGRLWRHDRSPGERRGHTGAVLTVLVPGRDELHALKFGTSAYVYEPDILARSAVLVAEYRQWRLPAACRELVAELYDRDDTYWTAERMEADAERLAKVRARAHATTEQLESSAEQILMPDPDAMQRGMDTAFSDDDREEGIAIATRYGINSATAVLAVMTTEGPRFLGAPEVSCMRLPAADDVKAVLAIEEAVMLSAVSFPQYRPVENAEIPEPLARLAAWWKERNPYDNKMFFLLDEQGVFRSGELHGSYSGPGGMEPGEGLRITQGAVAE